MALPSPANTTFDIWRYNGVAAASTGNHGILRGVFEQGREAGEQASAQFRFTHVLLVEPTLDLRDDFDAFAGTASQRDTVRIPDSTGLSYRVVFLERVQRGLAADHKRVYLQRAEYRGIDLTQGLLLLLLGSSLSGSASDPIATWADTSGNGLDATQGDPGFQPTVVESGGQKSALFDGTDDLLELPASALLKPDHLTLAAWVNVANHQDSAGILSLDYRGDGTWNDPVICYNLQLSSGGSEKPDCSIAVNGTNYNVLSGTYTAPVLATATWYHLALTFDGVTLKLYVDAVEGGSLAVSGLIDYAEASSSKPCLGANSPHGPPSFTPFNGELDGIHLYNRALTAAEVQALFLEGR